MSRLIFEGDTTERFGELFPKPFIEQVRIFDNVVETDVALYFQIQEGLTASEFLQETGMDQLKVFIGPIRGEPFQNAANSGNGLEIFNRSVVLDDLTGDNYRTYPLGDNQENSDFFYNSDGIKYIKFLITDNTWTQFKRYPGSEKFIVALTCFGDADISGPSMESTNPRTRTAVNIKLYGKQTSEVSFEKVFNEDGSVNTDKQQVYIQPDGNYYNKTPLYSLDRRYRKTDIVDHKRVSSIIEPIIQPFVGSVVEADLISETLQTLSDDPRLLTKLQRNVSNFSNKSTATAIGTIYGQLVDAISGIDAELRASQVLQKRSVENLKIKDRRREYGLIGDKINTNNTRALNLETRGTRFVDLPFISRYVRPIISKRDDQEYIGDNEEDFIVDNQLYFFVDYEKLLNYKSEISEFFNPYNIFQLFGRNSLNKYYKIGTVNFKKVIALQGADDVDASIAIELSLGSDEAFETTLADYDRNFISKKVYENNSRGGEAIYSQIVERAFDTVEGLGGYRLKCYEVSHLETVNQARNSAFYSTFTAINDTTMQFFDKEIRQKMFDLRDALAEYVFFASQFCSYNNIDGKFNDFFVEAIRNEFGEPYPWEEAPLYFYSVDALMRTSFDIDFDISPTTTTGAGARLSRIKNGTLIDTEKVKNMATMTRNNISPKTGTLELLIEFNTLFENFVNGSLGYNSVIGKQIYVSEAGGGFSLKKGRESQSIIADFNIDTEIIDSYDLMDAQYISGEVDPESLAAEDQRMLDEQIAKCKTYQDNWSKEARDLHLYLIDLEGLRGFGNKRERAYERLESSIRFLIDFQNVNEVKFSVDGCGTLLSERITQTAIDRWQKASDNPSDKSLPWARASNSGEAPDRDFTVKYFKEVAERDNV